MEHSFVGGLAVLFQKLFAKFRKSGGGRVYANKFRDYGPIVRGSGPGEAPPPIAREGRKPTMHKPKPPDKP